MPKSTPRFPVPRISAPGAAAAVGAGLASATLSLLVAQKTSFALALGFLSPLPIMIAALGFGSLAGLIAVGVGAAVVGVFHMRPEGLIFVPPGQSASATIDILVFAVSLGVPAWLLARLAGLSPAVPASPPAVTPTARPDEVRVGRLLTVAVGFAAIAALLEFALRIAKQGDFAAVMAAMTAEIEPLLKSPLLARRPLPPGWTLHDIAVAVVWGKMPEVAARAVVLFVFNLWLAARIAQTSGLFSAPWPDIARHVRNPRPLAVALAVALGLSFAGGVVGMSSLIVSGALMMGFALQGLAVIHAVTRGKSFRLPLLILVYISMTILMPVFIVLYGLIGLLDTAFAFRDREKKTVPVPGPWRQPPNDR